MNHEEYRQRQARSFYSHLREATNPVFFYWQDPDSPLPQIGGEPRGVSGYTYQSDNMIQLAMAAKSQGFQSPYWMTYDQAKAAGGTVKRGEVGTKIIQTIGGKDGKPLEDIQMTVFNGDQISGLNLPRHQGLSPQQQATRQAGLDALIPPRKKTPTPAQYNARLAEVMAERFPGGEGEQETAKATLRRELATLAAQARLGLPRQVDPSLAETLKPYADERPNWREVQSAISDSHKALKELGIEPLTFEQVPRREVKAQVKPAEKPRTLPSRTKSAEKGKAKDSEIPF